MILVNRRGFLAKKAGAERYTSPFDSARVNAGRWIEIWRSWANGVTAGGAGSPGDLFPRRRAARLVGVHRIRCSGDQNGRNLGQGGSPQHGELHWVHRVGDWGFAGPRRGEGRRRFAGEQFSPDSEGAHGKRSTDNFLTKVCGFASVWPSQREAGPRVHGGVAELQLPGGVARGRRCNTRFIKGHKPSNHIRARIKSHVYTTE